MTRFSSFKSVSLALGYAALWLNAPLHAGEQVPFKGTFDPIVVSATPVDATHVGQLPNAARQFPSRGIRV